MINSRDINIALSKKHSEDFFITECKNGPTWFGGHLRMDAVAIKKSWSNPCVTVYEVKVSRNDFLRDNKWPEYLQYCNRFYFACPKGLIKKEDIPDPRIGLIYINDDGNCYTAKSVPMRPVEIPPEFYQYILFSRIGSDRIPFYSDKKQYIQDYIENKRSAKDLSHTFNRALINRAAEIEKLCDSLKRENEALQSVNGRYEQLMAIFGYAPNGMG